MCDKRVEPLPGWTVVREVPSDVLEGIRRGTYDVCGGVIRRAVGEDGAGQVVRHLLPVRSGLGDSGRLRRIMPSRLRTTQSLLHVATGTMLLSGLDLAVSAVGFAVLNEKLNVLEDDLRVMISKVDGIAELLKLEERAKLKATLKNVSALARHSPVGVREHAFLKAVLDVFGPVNEKYRELLREAPTETAMACQEYFALTSLATATCYAELEMTDMARTTLEDDYTFWTERARRIVTRDLLGENPERFFAAEFVSEVSLPEVAAWINFAEDEDKSEEERIDALRQRIHLFADADRRRGSIFGSPRGKNRSPAMASPEAVEADKGERIPALRRLVARNDVFRGYVAQYALLAENAITPSAFWRKVKALDPARLVDGYVILQPEHEEGAN